MVDVLGDVLRPAHGTTPAENHVWSLYWNIHAFKVRSLYVHHHLSLVTRKPIFGVCDEGKLKPAYAATEARLESSDIETRSIILSRQRTTKVLSSLRGCAGWSAPLLFAYWINRFSHDVAHSETNLVLSLRKLMHIVLPITYQCLYQRLTRLADRKICTIYAGSQFGEKVKVFKQAMQDPTGSFLE